MKRILMAIAVLVAAAAAETDKAMDLTRVEQRLAAGKAREVTVELVMAEGQLEVTGGAAALFELDSYGADSSSAPEMEYEEEAEVEDEGDEEGLEARDTDEEADDDGGLEGHVEVSQPELGEMDGWTPRWDVRLDAALCREVEATVGDGFVKMTLAGTAVEEVELDVALGDVTLDLRGDGPAEFEGSCEAGLGDVNVFVPAGAAVRVEAETEMGKVIVPEDWTRDDEDEYWLSPEWGKGGRVIELELSAGMGDIRVIQRPEMRY